MEIDTFSRNLEEWCGCGTEHSFILSSNPSFHQTILIVFRIVMLKRSPSLFGRGHGRPDGGFEVH